MLVNAQTSGTQNGVWVANSGANWTRGEDLDEAGEAISGLLVPVVVGTTNGGSVWILTNEGTTTPGTTAMVWENVGGGGGAGDLLAANNLSDVASPTASRTNLGVGTGDSPMFTALNLGHATDTTITRVSAGLIAVEGSNVLLASAIGVSVQAYDADLTTLGAGGAGARSFLGLGLANSPVFAGLLVSGSNPADEILATVQNTSTADGSYATLYVEAGAKGVALSAMVTDPGDDTMSMLSYGGSTRLALGTNGNTILRLTDSDATFYKHVLFSGVTHSGIILNNLTTTERDALAKVAGALIWNTVTERLNYTEDTAWYQVATSTDLAGYLPLAGGTMTGLLLWSGTGHAGLRLNNLTTGQRDALGSPAAGMLVENTTQAKVDHYDGTRWVPLVDAAQAVLASQVFG